jgi:endo-1,4-beta-xylanase
MLVVGQYGDRVMVAIEENTGRTANSPQTPRLFMVSLPRAQFEQLVSQSGAEIDGGQIRFNQDTTAPINNIEQGLAEELEGESAALFADIDPEGVLYENPLVPFPEEDIEYKEVIAQEGKVVAVNEEGSEIATAVYEEEDNMWEWNVEFTNSKEYQSGIDHYLKVMDLKIDDVVIAQETIFIADQAYQVITAEPDPAKLSQECEKYKMAYKKVPLFIGVTSDTTEWASISRSLNILNQGLDRNIGSQIVYYKLDDPAYTDLARTTFNQYLVSGELNEPTLWAEPDPNNLSQDSYSYSRADEVARFAEKEGAAFMATHLIDSKREDYLPKWLREGSYTRDQYIEILKGHVRGAIHHFSEEFPDLPVRYSVVNEPFDWNKLAGFWHEKIGPEFIEIAYKAAREANPQAQLYFNDVNVFWEGGIDDHDRAVYNQVKSLKDKGLIDGVGLQMHLDATKLPNVSVVRDLIKMYQDIGVKVYITEFDVDISGLQMSSPVTEQLHKAQVFAEMLQVFLDSSAVDSVTYFGFSPSVSWKPQSDAHMFDNRLNPQAAFYSIASTIYQQIQ